MGAVHSNIDNKLADALAVEQRMARKLSRAFNAWTKARRAVARLDKRVAAEFERRAQS